ARKASGGLVGGAKRDGEWGSEVVLRHLGHKPPEAAEEIARAVNRLEVLVKSRQPGVGQSDDLQALSEMEQEEGQRRDIEEFKFPTNAEMLAAIRRKKAGAKVSVSR